MGCGLGYIDIYLLASAKLGDVSLCTLDRSLAAVASWFGITYDME
jgi:hypothetical protein